MADPTAPGGHLPPEHVGLLRDLATLFDVPRLRLFGGAALDLLRSPAAACADLDIALSNTPEPPPARLGRLARCPDVSHVGPVRRYRIRHDIPVLMADVGWRGRTLDVNFVDAPDAIGHFDVERVHWSYPECRVVDRHGVVGRPVRTLRLVSGPRADHPLLLVNRLLKLTAKYDVDPTRPTLRELIARLGDLDAALTAVDDFDGPQAHAAHLRGVVGAVRRSRGRERFLHRCVAARLLDVRLRPLARALRADPAAVSRLARAADDDAAFWNVADRLVARGGPAWRNGSPC